MQLTRPYDYSAIKQKEKWRGTPLQLFPLWRFYFIFCETMKDGHVWVLVLTGAELKPINVQGKAGLEGFLL